MKKFSFYRQSDAMDCGPTCLRMIAKHYGRAISLEKLKRISETTRLGANLRNISDAAEGIGFRSLGVKTDFNKLKEDAPLPCILHWNQNHFVVLYKIKRDTLYVADPGHGLLKFSTNEFMGNWTGQSTTDETNKGVALLLEPTPRLRQSEEDDHASRKGFSFLSQYLFRYKKFILQLCLGLLAGSLLNLIFPFLTQSIVDIGIQNRDINFIYLILLAQLLLFMGRASIEVIRGWILLHLSTRINISLVSDFFIKLMNLPISYFDVKVTGDIMQRINDHRRIENLLTTTSLNTLFSFFNLIVFGAVLAWYDPRIFFIFLAGSTLYITWVLVFLKRRKDLDYKRFSRSSEEQSKVIELINGMQEIKLHNAEKQKRWSWEHLQARLYKIAIKSLALEQTQSTGSSFINELKNIMVTVFAAKLVIDGDITLGMMLSISFITGQLNGPILQLVNFVYTAQDARIALERLSEIHNKEDEEDERSHKVSHVPGGDIVLKNVSFRYAGGIKPVLQHLHLTIPDGKITAIVGSSGSGKTTLMKLLLKFYQPQEGEIKLGSIALDNIAHQAWRERCGVVMQEGFIFNDTIANNIAVGAEHVDPERLVRAAETANIRSFIEELPLGYNTKIGMEGLGLSTGQKQRILIARAVYKNPEMILFDEATSALDAENERQIMFNLEAFMKGRTAVVIAHRLSTVKHADQIVVLDNGKIIELGTHDELVEARGRYFHLVKNQLQLEKLDDN
ncbi:MAG: peptidase domain-containing ABC transporter [Flavobacteriales bacterium]|nr:peptidase domain-containing ABC transporter [Flavobacteriales bacterium]